MRISTRYTLYQQSVLWPKFHKLLTMRQAASVSSVYNSRKGCTAQYLAGAGVQKPEYLLSLSCIFGDQLNRGNSVWSSWATKAGVIILTVLPHSPLSLAEKIMQKLAFAISCLATFQFKSENSTKHQYCVADKAPKEQPWNVIFLNYIPKQRCCNQVQT